MTPLAWKLSLILTLVSFLYLGLRPTVHLPDIQRIDLGAHMAFNAILAWMAFHAFPKARPFGALFVGLLIYGGAIELLQSLTPNRVPSVGDFVANGTGLALGSFAATRFRQWRRARRRRAST